jgi:hypothetical protein
MHLRKENQHCTGLFELKVNWSLCIGTNKLINLFNHKGGAKGINFLSVVRRTAARGDPQQIDFLGINCEAAHHTCFSECRAPLTSMACEDRLRGSRGK